MKEFKNKGKNIKIEVSYKEEYLIVTCDLGTVKFLARIHNVYK